VSLVNKDTLVRQVLQILRKIEPPAGIELFSYKRDRKVAVFLLPDQQACILEQGFEEQELTLPVAELPKILKTMIKREFPRSRKVRVYRFSDPEELSGQYKVL